jgi:predicted nucleic acid-binding protein
MTTAVAETVFVDTNVLIYANVDPSPFHPAAIAAIQDYEATHTKIWISRQVLREYLATLARPRVGIPITTLTAQVRLFEERFSIAEDGPEVTKALLTLLEQSGYTQVHDTNIVATMLTYGISHLLTHNTSDFVRFAHLVTIVPLDAAP